MLLIFLNAALVTPVIGAVAVPTTYSTAQDDDLVILTAIMQQAGCGCPSGEPSTNNPKARRCDRQRHFTTTVKEKESWV